MTKKSKAISPEVLDIFNRIEKQADEYEEAFKSLTKFNRDAEKIKQEVNDLILQGDELYDKNIILHNKFEAIESYINLRLSNMYEEIKQYLNVSIIDNFNQKLNVLLDSFKQKADDAIHLITGAEGIFELIDKTTTLTQELQNKIEQVDTRIELLNKRSDFFDTAKDEYYKNNQKIDENIEQMRNIVNNTIIDTQVKFDNAFNNATYILENRIKQAIIDTKDTQIIINSKTRTIDDKIRQFMVLTDEIKKHIDALKDKTKSPATMGAIDELRLRIENINARLEKKILELYNLVSTNM